MSILRFSSFPRVIRFCIEDSRYNGGLFRYAERAAGLPQGYPLVPMVANVVIDDIMGPIREHYRDEKVAVIEVVMVAQHAPPVSSVPCNPATQIHS